ncbi:MAG: hypothetical protein KU38_06175 [Sulfurovum sp. FS08-3]|nr:MAG: hypothetical protein KU38_06175 [Sulfurovum sp. FS08-3]
MINIKYVGLLSSNAKPIQCKIFSSFPNSYLETPIGVMDLKESYFTLNTRRVGVIHAVKGRLWN